MEDPPFIGDWYRERKLGNGTFGSVFLWRNKKTNESVAIKKFLAAADKGVKEKCEHEIELITNIIKCEHIVKAVKVEPANFLAELSKTKAKNATPVLCLEFCDGGDLRRVLENSENTSCGLKELEVRAIVTSLRSAVGYLHSLGITHRDLKPESIVIKTDGDRVNYKLTDLGVAKDLDSRKLNSNFVGTMEYLAPELLTTSKFTSSVDYWSLGIVIFEIICGVRPFLPHCPVARWMVYAQKKGSEDICITEDNQDQIHYHKTMLEENRISKSLRKEIEKWLVLALEWNPKQRGYAFVAPVTNNGKPVQFDERPTQTLKIFSQLDEILEKKYLIVFSLFNCAFYSFEVNDATSMEELSQEISNETGINVADIELVLPLEHTATQIDENTRPIDLYMPHAVDRAMIYVFKNGVIHNPEVPPFISKSLQTLFLEPKVKLKAHVLRDFARNAVFVVHHQQQLYTTLLTAIRTYAVYLNDRIVKFRPSINLMLRNSFATKGAIEQFNETLEIIKTRIGRPDALSDTYTDQCSRIESNINALCEASERISRRYDSVLRRSQDAINHELMKTTEDDVYNVKVLNVQFNLIRTQIAERRPIDDKSHINILNSVLGCLKKREKLLQSVSLKELTNQLVNIKVEMNEIIKAAEMAGQTKKSLKRALGKLTGDQLNLVWMTKTEYLPNFDDIMPPKFKIGDPVTPHLSSKSLAFIDESDNTRSLIQDCQSLIVNTDKIIKDGYKFIQEIDMM